MTPTSEFREGYNPPPLAQSPSAVNQTENSLS